MADIKFNRNVQNDYPLQKQHPFKKKTGNAKKYYQLIFEENLENDLIVLHNLYKQNIPFKVFGLHTNLYITENGYDGFFLDISHKNAEIVFDEEKEIFTVTSNVTVSDFVNFTMEKGYDFSALTGIPGFIGSGVVGNSGWTPSGKVFSDFVQEITVYDFENAKITKFIPNHHFFGDRDSFLKQENKNKTRYFVKKVILKADFIGTEAVKEKFNKQMNKRKEGLKVAFQEGTAGSFWSNPDLTKKTGKSFLNMLKENPSINANFNGANYSSNGNMHFTTTENTKDKDVAKLLDHTLKKVKELYDITLHKEVIILDKDGEIDLGTFIKRNILK